MDTKEKEPEGFADKKYHFYKKWTIFLLLLLILLLLTAAGGAAFFYSYFEKQSVVQAAAYTEQLKEAQETIDTLKIQKEALEEQVQMLPVIAEDGSVVRIERIPFEVNLDDWKYLLVNEQHPLAEDFTVALAKFDDGQYVDKRIKNSLNEMFAAAKKDGMRLMVCSSYRDYRKQDALIDAAIKRYMKRGMNYTEAFFEAKEQIALTGTSEHHTGLAVDIVGVTHQSLDASQADTKEAIWLKEHAAEYGFVLRFPADKEKETGIAFESWHFRYVGRQAAAYMKKYNLCLEEFIELSKLQRQLEQEAA